MDFSIAKEKTGCKIEDILVVFFFLLEQTESHLYNSINKTVTFLYDTSARFTTVNTCDLQLHLPTAHGEDFIAFKDALVMTLKDNDGFGGV